MIKLYDLIVSRRTFRAFLDKPVDYSLLERFVNAGRLAPQAANRQPLEFIVVDDPEACKKIFTDIKLAGYLDWNPDEKVRPRAYIVILCNKLLQKPAWAPYDAALAAENICLAAWDEGIGSCLVGAFNKSAIKQLLAVSDKYDVMLLVALGYPAHKAQVEEMKDENVEYWRSEDGTFHVPKRNLKDVIHRNRF